MNKKGATLGLRVIIVGIALLVVLGFVLWMSSSGLRAAYEDVTRARNISTAQLEALKKAKAPEIKEMETEQEVMYQFLVDGANFIKDGKYNDAIKEYRKFYEECQKRLIETQKHIPSASEWSGYACGAIKREGIKFRILNALREKYYKNPGKDIESKDIDTVSVLFGISSNELKSTILLVKIAGYTSKNEDGEAFTNEQIYQTSYLTVEKDNFNKLYWPVAHKYRLIKGGRKSYCGLIEQDLNRIIDLTNNHVCGIVPCYLKAFETNTGEWKDKVKFTWENYQFLKEPYDYIKTTCGIS